MDLLRNPVEKKGLSARDFRSWTVNDIAYYLIWKSYYWRFVQGYLCGFFVFFMFVFYYTLFQYNPVEMLRQMQKKKQGRKWDLCEYYSARTSRWDEIFYFSFSQFRFTRYGNIALIIYERCFCTNAETVTGNKLKQNRKRWKRKKRTSFKFLFKWRTEWKVQNISNINKTPIYNNIPLTF